MRKTIGDFLGIPYRHQGRDFAATDCYGLVMLWHKHMLGRLLPDLRCHESAEAQAASAAHQVAAGCWAEVSAPEVGDVILLSVHGLPSHCGLVVGDGRFLHVHEGHTSCIERWESPRWARRVAGFYRFVGGTS